MSETNDRPVSEMEFSVRTGNQLRAHGVETLSHLRALDLTAFRRRKGVGRKTINEIRDVLRALEFDWRPRDTFLERVVTWALAHRTLTEALLRGEAVIVPADSTALCGLKGDCQRAEEI